MHNSLSHDHKFRLVKAGPRIDEVPPLWVLGLSEQGAKHTAKLGLGYIFGHFINPENGATALKAYYEEFSPSVSMKKTQSIVCVFVVCAETDQEAEELALTQDH